MFSLRRKPAPAKQGANTPRVDVAIAMKRKGTLATYVLEADGSARAVNERVEAALTITYDEDERRIPMPGRVSYHAAYRRFRQQFGLAMSIINASAQTGAVYGIEEGRAAVFTGKTIPMTYLVDLALKEDKFETDDQPMLVAISFGEAENPGSGLLVIGVNPDREMVLQDYVQSVRNFRTTIINLLGAMAAGANGLRGLGWDPRKETASEEIKARNDEFFAHRVLRVQAESLVALASKAKSYPREAMYRGFSQSALGKLALTGSTAALAASVAFCAAGLYLRKGAEQETAAVEARMVDKRQEVRAQLVERISGLGARLTLDQAQLMGAADELWRPGTKVSLNATLETATLTLIAPNQRDQVAPGVDRRSAVTARGVDAVLSDLRVTAPGGWNRTGLEASGDLNAWLVSFQRSPVERDLLDLVSGGVPGGPVPVGAVPNGPGQSPVVAQPLRAAR